MAITIKQTYNFPEYQEHLREEMWEAADREDYEKAAELRDQIKEDA